MLTIKRGHNTYTSIHNIFIDDYIEEANGEYVKVYLVLLRLNSDGNSNKSIQSIARRLELSEEKVIKALNYWASKKLLQLELCKGEIVCINLNEDLEHIEKMSDRGDDKVLQSNLPISKEKIESFPTSGQHFISNKSPDEEYGVKEVADFIADQDMQHLFYVIQKYMGRTISNPEYSLFIYMYKDLGFSIALIEYLVELCVGKGNANIFKMREVATKWAKQGIKTLEQAKALRPASQDRKVILQALGVEYTNSSIHDEYIEKWLSYYPADMVKIAIKKSVGSLNKAVPSYIDAIIDEWLKAGVIDVKDIDEVDAKRSENNKKKFTKNFTKKKDYLDFPQREYTEEDMMVIRLGATNET